MGRGRTKGDHDAKRAQIADAACQVFLEMGLARTSLVDIAKHMGYTTGVLRHYFADKDELLLFAKNYMFDLAFDRVREAAKEQEGVAKLRAMANEMLPVGQRAIDNYRLLAMFNGNAIGDSRLMKLQHRRNERNCVELGGVIEQLQKEGKLPKQLRPQLEAAGIIAIIDGLAEQVIMRPDVWSREELMSIVNRHIDGLQHAPRSRS